MTVIDPITEPMTNDEATIILIPGLMCDRRFWTASLGALSRTRRFVVPTLHGFDSLAAMAESILEATEGALHVVGHSMGGRVALELWDAAPERVRTLALLDTGVHGVAADEPARRRFLLDLAESDGMEAVAEQWIPGMIHPDRHDDRRLIDAIAEMVTSYRVDQYVGQVRALLDRRDAQPILSTITCPTLVACGSDDAWSPPAQHRDIATAIDGARLEIVAESGHMVAMEQPEATSRLLSTWLETR
ncbi:MAG: alpha/beta hydrolase [Ilumatobacteraceae bacterium]